MKTPQEVFNLAIESGDYPGPDNFMCYAINSLYQKRLINAVEGIAAKREIKKYLGDDSYSLREALREAILPNTIADRIEIYKNWESRPPLTWTQKCLFPLTRFLKRLSLPVFTFKIKQNQ